MAPPKSKQTIVWLASYPKSGNTWTRVFLANYLLNTQQPLPINKIGQVTTSDHIAEYYARVDGGRFNPQDHKHHVRLRERVLSGIASNGADMSFVKTHFMNGRRHGAALIPRQLTRAAICIVRNPLDIAVSFARHANMAPSAAVGFLADPEAALRAEGLTVRQYLGTWSQHVESWRSEKRFPVHLIRYEDLLARPMDEFGRMLDFLGIPTQQDRLQRAVEFSSFDELRSQEDRTAFIERPGHMRNFFNTGAEGQWQDTLSPESIASVRTTHGEMMERLGYLPAADAAPVSGPGSDEAS